VAKRTKNKQSKQKKRSGKSAPAATAPGRTVALQKLVKGSYDAAQTNADNREHWKWTDSLSADAAHDPGTRRILRERCRYEVANNCYAGGVVKTLAHDCIGTGPRLQALCESAEGKTLEKENEFVEREFGDWLTEVTLADKLRTLRMSKCSSGEGLGFITTNDRLEHPVKLDYVNRECDRLCSPYMYSFGENIVDGIELDELGYPVRYHIQRSHPGDSWGSQSEFDVKLAASVIHIFNVDRPEQHRGIPELTAALPLFALLRRFTLATVQAAEAAADIALYLEQAVNELAQEYTESADAFDEIPIVRGMLMSLPAGSKIGQAKAEHPGTTYDMFKREILAEIGRILNVPINVISGDSSRHNFSSGKLDHLPYITALAVEQEKFERLVLDRLYRLWIQEAVLIEGYLPQSLRMTGVRFNRNWMWQGTDRTIDELKKANANAVDLANNTATLAELYAKKGKDWRTQLLQRSKEVQFMRDNNIPFEPFAAMPQEQEEQPANA